MVLPMPMRPALPIGSGSRGRSFWQARPPMPGLTGLPALVMAQQNRRDLTVALVGFTSWMGVAWKLSRLQSGAYTAAEAALALGAAMLCLWPLALGFSASPSYARWRQWLVPAHLAMQHWIGLRFALPPEAQKLLATPSWARGMLPIFLATFCQPWLYLAFGACLQRTRLRTFLWTQPLLLVPMLWMGSTHCSCQLAATPDAAAHLRRIASLMQRCSAWLPVGSPPAGGRSGGGGIAGSSVGGIGGRWADQVASLSDMGACMTVHIWLVTVLAFALPAIIIHRLEGQEEHARQMARKQQAQQAANGGSVAAAGSAAAAAAESAAGAATLPAASSSSSSTEPPRALLLQRRQSWLGSAAELLLASYSAWLLVQLVLPLLD